MIVNRVVFSLALCCAVVEGWQTPSFGNNRLCVSRSSNNLHRQRSLVALNVVAERTKDDETATTDTAASSSSESLSSITEKYGLEAGLMSSMMMDKEEVEEGENSENKESAKSLLKKYGTAYLATSIPLALLSFSLCYLLVDNGVDVASLLHNLGIDQQPNADKVGTFAIAYAAHKAASPIRFPPTVILTPMVAKLIGKESVDDTDDESLAQ